MADTNDVHFMQMALRHSYRALGTAAPNPSVGCLIVKEGRVVGRGHTGKGGRPHAETEALKQAGEETRGATAYVTLEPCCHTGQTPPCTDALIAAGISRVVIATRDPYSKVNGQGIAALQTAGITVEEGVLGEEATRLHAGFFKVQTAKRPNVTLKLATTLDGMIASSSGKSQWITSEATRRYVHMLRMRHDAIMVGVGTVLADDPALTCRLSGLEESSPARIILDSTLRTPHKAKCVLTADKIPTYIFTTRDTGANARAPATLVKVNHNRTNHVDIPEALQKIAEMGMTRILVEAGQTLSASLLKEGLVDEIIWIHAPKMMGSKGMSAVGYVGQAFEAEALLPSLPFDTVERRFIGDETVTHLVKRQAMAAAA